MAAGAWSALLIVVRLFDRPLGQNLLALVCATLLALAGLRMRLKRPADDLPQARAGGEAFVGSGGADAGDVEIEFAPPAPESSSEDLTTAMPERREETAVRRPAPPPPAASPPARSAQEEGPEQPGPFRARPAPPPNGD
jgi:hypothetical protein